MGVSIYTHISALISPNLPSIIQNKETVKKFTRIYLVVTFLRQDVFKEIRAMFADSISLAPPLKKQPKVQREPTGAGVQGFAGGTIVRTIIGLRPVERLMAGDLLLDTRNRMVELRCIRTHHATANEVIRVEPSAFGLGLAPGRMDRALVVGAGQRLGVCDWRTEILFSAPALSPASRLVDGVNLHNADTPATLYELGFEHDTIITADGMTSLVSGSRA